MGAVRVPKGLDIESVFSRILEECEKIGSVWTANEIREMMRQDPLSGGALIFFNEDVGELEVCIDIQSSIHEECREAVALANALADYAVEPCCLAMTDHEQGHGFGDAESTRLYPIGTTPQQRTVARFLFGLQLVNDLWIEIPQDARAQIKDILVAAAKTVDQPLPYEGETRVARSAPQRRAQHSSVH